MIWQDFVDRFVEQAVDFVAALVVVVACFLVVVDVLVVVLFVVVAEQAELEELRSGLECR